MNDFGDEFESQVKVHLQTLEEWRASMRATRDDIAKEHTVEGSPPSETVVEILLKWFPEFEDEPRVMSAAAELQKVFDEERIEAVHDVLGG